MNGDELRVGMAQIAPVWLDRSATIDRVVEFVAQAGAQGCDLVAFGEALVPGYPVWLARSDGAAFNSPRQKELHAHSMDQAVQLEAGHLEPVLMAAKEHGTAVYLGCIERPPDRGGHSLYASLVFIDALGEIGSVQRKLMPTYEERLTWSTGDGHGLRTHEIGPFTVGGLNCWENWMPLARAALYGLGEDLHVAVWPGSAGLTRDITRFIALESRSYVMSVGGCFRGRDVPEDTPHREAFVESPEQQFADGGSCIAGPDGAWVVEPIVEEQGLFTAVLDQRRVREERQNFDPAGHYARPDVLKLVVDRRRQGMLELREE